MTEKPNTEIVWTRRGKSSAEPVLVGRRLSNAWLATIMQTMQVRLTGKLERALADLLDAARSSKQLNLPIVALRASLMAALEGVISLNRDLGLVAKGTSQLPPPAIELYPLGHTAEIASLRDIVAKTINRWCMDRLDPWAQKHGLADIALRVREEAQVENVSVATADRPLRRRNGEPDFALIVREVAERLVGQTLFAGMAPCELVVSPEYADNSMELMTPPHSGAFADDVYSMVARLSIVSVPYSNDVYLHVNAVKRVWSGKVPGNKPSAPRSVRGYVFSPGRPILPVQVERNGREGWAFSESYEVLRLISEQALPESLSEAISLRTMDEESGWWVGMPQSPRLFDSLAPRTVLETDELDLLRTVIASLPGIVDGEVSFKAWPMPKRNAKSHIAMLRVSDFVVGARAGDAIEVEDEVSEEGVNSAETETAHDRLEKHREQNVAALHAMHPAAKPVLWSFGGNPTEQDLIRKTVSAMFGESVELNIETLPPLTHGLRDNLPSPDSDARARFDIRVDAWRDAADAVASSTGARFALICAADQENRRAEDSVNYYAGMHAMCSIAQANVHHVLPMSGSDPERAAQSFIHRLQSALLDVFLAHSGVVFGVPEFLNRSFSHALPRAVYGIQAMRSKARAFTGETNVSFLIFSRLMTETGATEVQFVYKAGPKSGRTNWLPLAQGLRWLGSNRQLHAGDEKWLRATFKDSVRDTLAEIGQHDPRAIVLIDWSTVRGLWSGISDRDLTDSGTPKLDGIDLAAAFPEMSIVRLRRGPDSIALRSLKRLTFEGWRKSAVLEPTGERHVEEYATTTKTLVQVKPDENRESSRSGHFIVSMGYSKTAQIRRGMSCYRNMPRMAEVDEQESKLYERRVMDPARFDAPIPAPLEITVMSSPVDVPAHAVALAVTGLRLGYAHYNDWTALPAPLFFKRKIDDYVIRFSEGSPTIDETEGPEPITPPGEGASSNPFTSELLQVVLDPEGANSITGVGVQEELDEHNDTAVIERSDEEPEQSDASLLARAKRVDVRLLYTEDDLKIKRLYSAMMQETVQVIVELPSFVNPKGLFGQYEPAKRRAYDRAWESQRRFGYVKTTDRRPPTQEILDHIAQRLRIPQAAYSINSPHLFNGNIMFREVVAILDQYNSFAKEPIAPRTVSGLVNLGPVAKWACDINNDHALAWLIFYAAQLPAFGCAKNILGAIDRLPENSPLTEEALVYFLDCAAAVEEAYTQQRHVGRTFKPIRRGRDRPMAPVNADATTGVEHDAGKALQPTGAPPAQALKEEVLRLLHGLVPGDTGFQSTMDVLRTLIDQFQEIDAQIVAERIRLQEEREHGELERVRVEAEQAISAAKRRALEDETLGHITTLIEIPEFSSKRISLADCSTLSQDQIRSSLDQLRVLVDVVVKQQRTSDQLLAVPQPQKSTAAARAKRMAEELAALNGVADAIAQLEENVTECGLFTLEERADTSPNVDPAFASKNESAITLEIPLEASDQSHESAEPLTSSDSDGHQSAAVANQVQRLDQISPKQSSELTEATQVNGSISPEEQTNACTTEMPTDDTLTGDLDEGEFNLVNPAELNAALETLLRLTEQRRYALAQVHMAALAQMLPESVRGSHPHVLNALFTTLDTLDCRFSVDGRLDPAFLETLESPLVQGDLAHPLHLALGVFSAGLTNMLFDGPGTDTRWTVLSAVQDRFTGQPALSALAGRIGSIDTSAIVLSREKLAASHVGAAQAIDAEIGRMQARAASWSSDSELYTNWAHRGFNAVHAEMFSTDHSIGKCIEAISNGDLGRLKTEFAFAERKLQKSSTIDELARKCNERGKLDGGLRTRMFENLSTTHRFISTYLERAQARQKPAATSPDQTHETNFLKHLYSDLAAAIEEMRFLEVRTPLDRLYRHAAENVLQNMLRLYDETQPTTCIPFDEQLLLLQVPMGRDFRPSMKLNYPTPAPGQLDVVQVCDPAEVLQETTRLATESLVLDDGNDDELIDALKDAVSGHLAGNRFLPAFKLEDRLRARGVSTNSNIAKRHKDARIQFDAELQETVQLVAHAMAISALNTTESSRMQHVIESIRTANSAERSIGHPDSSYPAYPDFLHARSVLETQVRQALDAKLNSVRAAIGKEIDEYETEMGSAAPRDLHIVRKMLESVSASNLKTAHDAFAILRREGKLPLDLSNPRSPADVYAQFLSELKKYARGNTRLLESLREKLKHGSVPGEPEWLAGLDEQARSEAVEFLDAWLRLSEARNGAQLEPLLSDFFKRFGITQSLTYMPSNAHSQRLWFHIPEKAFVLGTNDQLFIPPVLGSRASHIQGCLVSGKPAESEIRQIVSEVGATPTFILAHNTFSSERRAKILRDAPAILIDDDLVAYMAMHPEDRLSRMMEVGLLTFNVNPYDDYGTRPVPPEMFFGRQRELEQLRNVKGAAVLYGGRRLGKSSLLSQIERESSNVPGSIALYIPVDGANYESDHVVFAWNTVYKHLVSRQVISPMQTAPMSSDQIYNWIEQELLSSRNRYKRIYLLLDEVDELMGKEFETVPGAPSFVRGLQRLCETVQRVCEVRYVIAGLHNSTRMATESNSPLGKAESIALQPYTTPEDIRHGMQLVRRPFAALGFQFESDDLLLRILSICNFYPAFIQLYCKNLLERMFNIRQDQKPPIRITADDLQAVEQNDKLLATLKDKFKLNLDLDKRYKAIALILAEVHYSQADSVREKGLTLSEIRDFCTLYTPTHFERTGPGGYEALVDEMQKLNVLEKVGTRYVLRNPNIAMMIGDPQRVSHLIEELAREKPMQSRSHGERRVLMTLGKQSEVFPMPVAWVRSNLDPKDGELLIIVGNNLSGLSEIIKQGEWKLDGRSVTDEGVYNVMSFNKPMALRSYIDRERRSFKRVKRLLAVNSPGWKITDLHDYASLATKEGRLQSNSVRIALLALPDKAYELAMALYTDDAFASVPESARSWRVEAVPAFTDDALFFQLNEQIQLSESADARGALLKASCGFGSEVVRLCGENMSLNSALKSAVTDAERKLAPNLATFYERMGMPKSVEKAALDQAEQFLTLVDGSDRNSPDFDDAIAMTGISKGMIHFLMWMGLLQDGPSHTWHVPPLYRRLLV